MNTFQFGFMPVGACNMDCPNCTQTPWRKAFSDYQMTPDEVREICRRIKELGLHFTWAHITGGEPALWAFLADGCRIMRESGAFDHIEVWTNCKHTRPIRDVLDSGLVDHIQTQDANASKTGIRTYRNGGYKLNVITPSEHRVHPDKPVPDSLPAECGCNRLMAFNYYIWPCANYYSNMDRLGLNVVTAGQYFSIYEDWKTKMEAVDRMNMEACRVCLANGKVWRTAAVGSAK